MKLKDLAVKYKIEIINTVLYLALGAVLLYLCKFKYFYQDDFGLIIRHIIKTPGDIIRIFVPTPGLFYRPLAFFMWGIDHLIWGANYLGYYFTNIVMHIASLFALYLIVYKLTKNKIAALLSEIAFLVYFPLNSGPISLLATRSSEMQVMFSLFSLYFFILFRESAKAKNRGVFYCISLLTFAAAVFSKEGALIMPLVFFCYDMLYGYMNKRNFIKQALWFYLPFLLVALFRFLVGEIGQAASPLTATADYYRWVFGINMFRHLIYYTLWIFPLIIIFYGGVIILNRILKLNLNTKEIIFNRSNLFFLAFIFIQMLPYLPLYTGRQLGWMQMSSFGAAGILGVSAFNFLYQVYFKDKRKFFAILTITLTLGIIIVTISGSVFLPIKYGKKVMFANYSKNLISELQRMYPNFEKDDVLYVIDTNIPEYSMKRVFKTGPSKVFDKALIIIYGEGSAPGKALILNESEAKDFRFGAGDIVLKFDGENLTPYKE